MSRDMVDVSEIDDTTSRLGPQHGLYWWEPISYPSVPIEID